MQNRKNTGQFLHENNYHLDEVQLEHALAVFTIIVILIYVQKRTQQKITNK